MSVNGEGIREAGCRDGQNRALLPLHPPVRLQGSRGPSVPAFSYLQLDVNDCRSSGVSVKPQNITLKACGLIASPAFICMQLAFPGAGSPASSIVERTL